MSAGARRRCGHEPLDLLQLNTRVWLRQLGVARLGAVPDAVLDTVAADGFDLVWLMGVWAPSAHAAEVARAHPDLQAEYRRALDDLRPDDVVASPYAIARYEVSPLLGGPDDLAALRARLRARGVGLVLDFVPNHTACDHPAVSASPEHFMLAAADAPAGETFVAGAGGPRIFCGRDPYFPPWTDTAQRDHRRASSRRALVGELRAVAEQCDGVRCDMAMLLLSDVVARTWQRPGVLAPPADDLAQGEFWPAAIDAVRARRPDFLFLAEAYWGTGPRLRQLGFDYTYDKESYDALVAGDGAALRHHLAGAGGAPAVRFIENHDEPRAASHFPADLHRVAALVALTLPGVRLVHQGQREGARRKLPVQLGRAPVEPVDGALAAFYRELRALAADPVLRAGHWQLLEPRPAWDGNGSHAGFVTFAWDRTGGAGGAAHRLLLANLAPHRAQCRVSLAGLPGLAGRQVALREIFATGESPRGDRASEDGRPVYVRDGDELCGAGLFVELPARTAQVCAVEPAS